MPAAVVARLTARQGKITEAGAALPAAALSPTTVAGTICRPVSYTHLTLPTT